jgi:hypothetical protein
MLPNIDEISQKLLGILPINAKEIEDDLVEEEGSLGKLAGKKNLVVDDREHLNVIHAKDESELTPLHLAARNDFGGVCEILIDRGADLEALAYGYEIKSYLWTPLHWASSAKL